MSGYMYAALIGFVLGWFCGVIYYRYLGRPTA